MSLILAAALLVQALAITLLRHRLGRPWLRHPVTIMVLVSTAYQGLSPLLLAIPSIGAWDSYRTGVQQRYIDSATLTMSVGMLAFTLGYLLTRPEQTVVQASPDPAGICLRPLDWRWLACGCVPLAVLTYEGRGYNNGGPATGAGASLPTALASEFFVILVALTALSFLLERGTRFFLAVLLAQSLLLAATGERAPVILDAITLILLLKHAGYALPRRQVNVAISLTLLSVLTISGSRAEEGRALYHQDNGLATRVEGLGRSLIATPSGGSGPGLLAQIATRLDGIDFAGAVSQSLALGRPRLSASYVPESLLIDVPSAMWPSKLAHAGALNPVQQEIDYFGLQDINFLPTLPGLYIGFLQTPWLVLLLASLGLLAGIGERSLFRYPTSARLVLLAGAINAALWYEQGIPGIVSVLRSAVAIAVVVKLIEIVRVNHASRNSASLPSPTVNFSSSQPLPQGAEKTAGYPCLA